MSKSINYNSTFSIMKGIAIMSVVLGHCSSYEFTEKFVNQYHLAVFFFVSGYLFKERYLNCFTEFVKRKLETLYVPFVLSGLVFILLHNFLYYWNIYHYPLSFDTTIHDIMILFAEWYSLDGFICCCRLLSSCCHKQSFF